MRNHDQHADPDPGLVSELAGLAVQLARGAAHLIRASDQRSGAGHGGSSGSALRVDAKSTSTDLVTVLDRASETWLVEHILGARPDDAILGEEGGERPGSNGVRWLLDPIDGTVNFVLGMPQYAVSVAAEVDGVVVAGAVCNPASAELFRASRGGGAWLGPIRLTGPRDVDLDRAVLGTGFAYDRAMRVRQGAVVSRLLGRVGDVRRMGAAALDLCAVASGRLDGYFEVGLNPWDYAAGALIVEEAGCVASDLDGQPVSPGMVVAAGPALAAPLREALAELDAGSVSSSSG